MARDINYSPEQHDSISEDFHDPFICAMWCDKCCDFHGLYDCPYEDYKFCPHCGQVMKRANEGGL